MRKIILSLLLSASVFTVFGQDFLLSEQWFSRLNRNPAATGNSEKIELFYLNRQQWVGFEDAPSTNILNAHAFFEGISSGLGFTFFHDKIGALGTQTLNAKLAYSYQTLVANEKLLSFGVSAGILNKSLDQSKGRLPNGNSPSLENESATNLDIDLGVEFSMPVFLAGVAVTHVLGDRKDATNIEVPRQFTGYVRGNINLTDKFSLAPGAVYNNYSSVQPDFFEINATTFYQRAYWLGVGTRFDQEGQFTFLNAIIGLEWKFLRIGYGYDYSLGKLGNLAKSSHEIMLSGKIGWKQPKQATQRFVRFME